MLDQQRLDRPCRKAGRGHLLGAHPSQRHPQPPRQQRLERVVGLQHDASAQRAAVALEEVIGGVDLARLPSCRDFGGGGGHRPSPAARPARANGISWPAMRLAVIACFLNEEKYLPDFLESLAAQEREPERMLLVDDGSSDASLAIAREYAGDHPSVRV